jgi:CelD/BcsL family acetyltransferase involved in cellulose biosynthesis
MHIDIVSEAPAITALAPAWDALVHDAPDPVEGLDATATSAWLAALRRAHLDGRELRLVVARQGPEVLGLLPVVLGPQGPFGRRLSMAALPYCGRAAPMLGAAVEGVWPALLAGLDRACPDWASLDLMVTQGSQAHRCLQASGALFHAGPAVPDVSPCFPLGPSPEVFWAACSKSTRQLVRTARNKLEASGGMELRLVTTGATALRLIEEVLAIERCSWKHEAGTAITRHPMQEAFYRAWFPVAADAGLLFAAVMHVAGRPVAHNVGMLRDGVYCCLKHSHDQAFDKASPVYPLTAFLIDELMARGAHTFDFMGRSEPHKLRWSPHTRTYARLRARLFRDAFRGRALAAMLRTRSGIEEVLRGWRHKPEEMST